MSRRFLKSIQLTFLLVFLLGIILIFSIYLINNSSNNQKAKAGANIPEVSLSPGEVIEFTIRYDNASFGQTYSGPAEIFVYIDELLEYVPGYLKDSFAEDLELCVNDTNNQIVSQTNYEGKKATKISYTPRTATLPSNQFACQKGDGSVGGQATSLSAPAANFDRNNQSTWRGMLTFRVKLRSDILETTDLKPGDLISPDATEHTAIVGGFKLGDTNYGQPKFAIRIAGTQLNLSQDPSLSGNGIDKANCINQPITAGEVAVCQFGIRVPNPPVILPSDLQIWVDTASSKASLSDCIISTSNNLMTCSLPTEGATIGDQSIYFSSSQRAFPKGSLEIADNFDREGDSDSDGISNGIECNDNTTGGCRDTDLDGYLDWLDPDSDNDGIPDIIEAICTPNIGSGSPCDSEADGVADYIDSDSDNDGFLDKAEKGDMNCDYSTLNIQCQQNPADSNNDLIPDYRLFNIKNESFLIKDEHVFIGGLDGQEAEFQVDDMVMTVDNLNVRIQDCTIRIKKYDSNDPWLILEEVINSSSNGCSAILPKEKQNFSYWEVEFNLVDENNNRWATQWSYRLKVGPLGKSEIEITGTNQPKFG